MGKDKKSSPNISTVILLVFMIISAVFIILLEIGAFRINKTTNNIVKYTSVSEAIDSVKFEVTVPDFVLDVKNTECRVVNGVFFEIGSEEIVFKASEFIDYNADPLALYNISEVDEKYTVKESTIHYFRYRIGYENMGNCTIVNWVQGDTSYGLILNSIYKKDELFNMLGINKNNIMNYEESLETEQCIEYDTILIGNKFTINIPTFKTSFKTVDLDGYTICYLDNTKVFVLIYDDYNIDSNTFGGQSEVTIDSGVILRYLSENPFDIDTMAYIDYNTFICTIDNIIDSIEYH